MKKHKTESMCVVRNFADRNSTFKKHCKANAHWGARDTRLADGNRKLVRLVESAERRHRIRGIRGIRGRQRLARGRSALAGGAALGLGELLLLLVLRMMRRRNQRRGERQVVVAALEIAVAARLLRRRLVLLFGRGRMGQLQHQRLNL